MNLGLINHPCLAPSAYIHLMLFCDLCDNHNIINLYYLYEIYIYVNKIWNLKKSNLISLSSANRYSRHLTFRDMMCLMQVQWMPPLGIHFINLSPFGQNGRHFADDIFRCIFMNEKLCILMKIWLKFVPKGPIDNNPALVQIMAWCRKGDKPLSQPMLTRFTDAYMRH